MLHTCGTCERQFASTHALFQHTEAKHGRRAVHHGVRSWEAARNQRGELTTANDWKDYRYEVSDDDYDDDYDQWCCALCGRMFDEREHLEMHLRSGVHEQHLYKCQGCKKTFRTLSQLHIHNQTWNCSQRSARQMRMLLADAKNVEGRLMLSDKPANQLPVFEGTLFFDGAAKPNPGWGGAGYSLHDDLGYEIASGVRQIEPYGVTSNQAEYVGLICGLKEAMAQGMKRILVKGDSELLVRQMTGVYNVTARNILMLHRAASTIIKTNFKIVKFQWIPRHKNTVADALANEGADGECEETVRLRKIPA